MIIRAKLARWGAAVAVAAVAFGCSQAPAPPPVQQAAPAPERAIPASDRAPAVLGELSDSAKAVFDAVDASSWNVATEMVHALNESATALPNTLPKPDLVAQLQSRVTDVTQSVGAHQRVEAMDAANAVTQLVADLSAEFPTQVPFEAGMLGYYVRQLELGIASGRLATLTQAGTDLRSTWNRLEPALQRRGNNDDAKRFTDIVVNVESAHAVADFVGPTKAAKAEADHIEKLFQTLP